MTDKVILVDENDNVTGSMDKLEAHQKGVLHRAFSILIFNSNGELLLQKRSTEKYHSGGLWTNACCSHPAPNETIADATRNRPIHEMGIDVQPEFVFKFLYHAKLDKELIEHELDYVFTGLFNGSPKINSDEVEEWKFMSPEALRKDMRKNPAHYTVWFRLIMTHPELNEIAA